MYLVGRVFIRTDDPEFPLVADDPNISDAGLARKLFLHYPRWLTEHESGLKWECGTNFLHKLLPFLARVLVQDGVYWVAMYPLHEVSQLLIAVFGERYLEWADRQREAVRNVEEDAKNKQIQALDAGAQAAFSSIKNDVVQIPQYFQRMEAEVRKLREALETNTQLQQMQRQQHLTLAMNQSTGLRQNRPTSGATRERMVELCPPRSLVPYFPSDLPVTMQKLLEEHLQYKLEEYRGVSKKSWGAALAMAYSRRSYLFRLIVVKASMLRSGNDMAFKLQEAARQLDEERGTMSVYTFYEAKKASDAKRQKRKVNPVQGGKKRPRQIEI